MLIMLNILINDLADHPESIIYKFMNDAKLRQESCTMNERTRIHRDIDKLEKRAHGSLMIFNKEKNKLILVQCNLAYNQKVSSSPAEKIIWTIMDCTLNILFRYE